MDFAAALKKLEKDTSSRHQQRDGGQQQRDGGDDRGGGRSSYPPRDGGGYSNRRRGRDQYHRDDDDRPGRTQRPRYNDNRGDRRRDDRGGGYYGRDDSRGHHGGSGYPLEEMHRSGYRVPSSSSSYSTYRLQAPPPDVGKRPFHIALLCICIDGLPYEHLWREWAKTGNAHVSLLVHAKHPDKIVSKAAAAAAAASNENENESSAIIRSNRFVRDRLLTHPPRIGRGKSYADPEYLTHTPAWGSVQITRAMMELLSAASAIGTARDIERSDARFMSQRYLLPTKLDNSSNGKDIIEVKPDDIPPVDKFIFISETCIPVQTLQECEMALFGDKSLYSSPESDEKEKPSSSLQEQPSITPWQVSWVNARHPETSPGTPRNKYERDQFSDLHPMIPNDLRWKADQWHALSRPHALAVLDLDRHFWPYKQHLQLWNQFGRINASDEMYFPTALGILGILNTKDVLSATTAAAANSTGSNTNNDNANDHGDQKPPPRNDDVDNKTALTAAAPGTTTTSTTTTTTRTGIAIRPITYTDWSEGMRNPATFTKGMRDFLKVAKLARQQGSLMARKFAPVCPGAVARAAAAAAASSDNKKAGVVIVEPTGQITAQEWREQVERMASEAAAAAAAAAVATAAAQETKEDGGGGGTE